MQHASWTRHGRLLVLPTGQHVYKAQIGQQNIELDDGSFAPFVWDGASQRLRYGEVEAHFSGDEICFFVDGVPHASTRVRVQRRADGRWVDELTTVRIERLSDEDDGPIASARIAVTLESARVRAQHIIVAGGWRRARADTEVRALAAGEYRVAIQHRIGEAAFGRGGGAEGYIATSGWRVAWTIEEGRDRETSYEDGVLHVRLPSVRRLRRQTWTPAVLVSPDTYGPVTNAGGGDDVMSNALAYREDGFSGFGEPWDNRFYLDDGTTDADTSTSLRFPGIPIGTPTSIDSGTQLSLTRTSLNAGGGANGVVRLRCQASNTPATASNGDRPYARSHNAAFNDHTFPADTTTVTPSVQTAIAGLISAGYSYDGSPTAAILITLGASVQWGITSVSFRGIGSDQTHATGTPARLTIVYTPGGGNAVSTSGLASAEVLGTPALTGGVSETDEGALGSAVTLFDHATFAIGGIPFEQLYPTQLALTSTASAEAFGGAAASIGAAGSNVAAAGNIASAEAVGTPTRVNQRATASAIVSAEALGAGRLRLYLAPGAVGGAEAHGAGRVNTIARPSSIAPAEAFGAARSRLYALVSAIASGEAIGAPIVGVFSGILPAAISSVEAFGTTRLNLRALMPAIASVEAFGAARTRLYAITHAVATSEAFGAARTIVYARPSAVVAAEAFGSARMRHAIFAGATASAGVFGAHALTSGVVVLQVSGVASAVAFGSHAAAASGFMAVPPIATGEAFGVARFKLRVLAPAMVGAEAFGTGRLGLYARPAGVATVTALGAPLLRHTVRAAAIDTGFATGPARLGLRLAANGIASAQVVGSAALQAGGVVLLPAAIVSVAAFGVASIFSDGALQVQGIETAENVPSPVAARWAFPLAFSVYPLVPGPITPSAIG